MPLHSLTNFEIQKYFQKNPKFNGVYSKYDEYESVETHSIALYVNAGNITYFHSFRVEHIRK